MNEINSIFEFVKYYTPNLKEKVIQYGISNERSIVDSTFVTELDQLRFIKVHFVETLENYNKQIVRPKEPPKFWTDPPRTDSQQVLEDLFKIFKMK